VSFFKSHRIFRARNKTFINTLQIIIKNSLLQFLF